MTPAPGGPAMSAPTFSVYTPTYNRARELPRAYASLQAQTCRDFEWVVVDDGSDDDTATVIERCRDEADFPVRYVRQDHGGLHVALNRCIAECRCELAMPLDSDDTFVPETLERFLHHWRSIPEGEREGFSGVTAQCVDQHGNPTGDPLPREVLDSDSLELRYRYKVRGQRKGFHRTEVLRQHPFPATARGGGVGRSQVWTALARTHKTRYVAEPLYVWWLTESAGQITKTAPAKHAEGHRQRHLGVLNEDWRWVRHDPGFFFRSAAHYARFSLHHGVGLGGQSRDLGHLVPWLFWLAMLPVGIGRYWLDRLRAAD